MAGGGGEGREVPAAGGGGGGDRAGPHPAPLGGQAHRPRPPAGAGCVEGGPGRDAE